MIRIKIDINRSTTRLSSFITSKIVIKPVAGRAGEYLAYCRSVYLDATYAVYFKDSLMGGLALHSFIGMMIEGKYKDHAIRVLVSEEELLFKNEALLNVPAESRSGRPTCCS